MTDMAVGTSGLRSAFAEFVNPQWTAFMDLLNMNVKYQRAYGNWLETEDGRRILDCLAGYSVYNIGHNHPYVVDELKRELDRSRPMMLQSSVSELAGELAERLCRLAGGRLSKVFFCNSGSESTEAAMKFARAITGRPAFLSCQAAFHGLTTGALSLMSGSAWTESFGPLLPDAARIPFGDIDALSQELSTRRFAGFFVEPIQAEGGIKLPSDNYLLHAQKLCRQNGTCFIVDEIQTGLYRTGPFLASHHFGIEPDIILLAKALSGGIVPVAAVLMSNDIYHSVFGSVRRAAIHNSTFGENALAMRAGLATLEVLEKEKLGEKAARLGEQLRSKLNTALKDIPVIEVVRGAGLLNGIAIAKPVSPGQTTRSSLSFESLDPSIFAQALVRELFRKNILTQLCANNFTVVKMTPPLSVEEEDIDIISSSVLSSVTDLLHSSASLKDAIRLARKLNP